jgi:hypothetical protein
MFGELNYKKTPMEIMKLDIFTGKEEKFAFRRAVSRLKEMQTKSYLETAHSPILDPSFSSIATLPSTEHKESEADHASQKRLASMKEEDIQKSLKPKIPLSQIPKMNKD